jgi:murein DD-endopeptidase MepM/ murein hydrolase activator NlpD
MLGIPRHTRIILIPDDERSSREYGVSRAMVVTLMFLGAMVAGALVLMMIAFAVTYEERLRIIELENELAAARQDILIAEELVVELEQMRVVQERLLTMLGVEDAVPVGSDTLAAWLDAEPGSASEGLKRAAAVVLSPEPDQWPAKGFVTREFIEGNIARGIKPHLAIDIAGPTDAPITAAGNGTVIRTGTDDFLGNFVEIQHGLGYLTVYGHCSRIAVGQGDRVQAGQLIAYMGKSGQASATHLHFEIWYQGEAIDPRGIVAGDPPQN